MAATDLSYEAFQSGSTPPPQGLASRVGSGIASVGRDAFNTLLVTPATRATEAATRVFAPNSTEAAGYQSMSDAGQSQNFNSPLGNISVAPQKAFGQGGGEQVLGQAAKSASYLAPAMSAEGLASNGIVQGAVQGSKLGALGGGLAGAGNAMEQGANTSDVLGNAATGAAEGGLTGAAFGGVTGLAGNIWDSVHGGENAPGGYQAQLEAATQANNLAGQQALAAGNEITGTFSDIKNDAGTQFNQAFQNIAQADPNAKQMISADFLNRLNELKDTKTFVLPDYLRATSENFGNGNIDISKVGSQTESGIQLTPEQSKDLITQLDGLAYKAKASGELAINEQARALAEEAKSGARDAYGHVVDAQGKSVLDEAYQNYRQISDLTDKMSDLFNINRTMGEVSSPKDLKNMLDTIDKYGQSTQGRAILQQSAAQIKAATGYDITDPIATITKLSESDANLAKAIKGGYGHQFIQGLKNPNMLSRRALFAATTILGITAAGAAFRKQIGNFIAGQ